MPVGTQEIAPVSNMTIDLARKPEILVSDPEGAWIDVHYRHVHAGSVQHGAKAAAAATDHQHIRCLHLRQKAKDRVYVRHHTYAVWVALALITATLPINE